MTEWEKKASAAKTYANAVTFINNKMLSMKTCQENSVNLVKRNGFGSINSALKIAEKMREILQEHIGSNEEETKAEHLI